MPDATLDLLAPPIARSVVPTGTFDELPGRALTQAVLAELVA